MKLDLYTYPLVSICIPTYNGEKFLEEAMESAIKQTYPNLEIVVSDDNSSDKTLDIINSFVSKTETPIHVFKHEPNGIGANWNNCVQKSTGKYIKFLFQDDLILPDCIEQMMTIMNPNDNVGLVYCTRNLIYKNLTEELSEFIDQYGLLHSHWKDFELKEGIASGKKYLKDRELLNSPKNKIGEPVAVLLNRACFDEVGWFNETLRQTLDYEYWYRVMTKFNIGFIDKNLASFRLHKNQASQINKQQKVSENVSLNAYYYKNLFWYLHPKNKLKLLKLYHPFFKMLVKIKNK